MKLLANAIYCCILGVVLSACGGASAAPPPTIPPAAVVPTPDISAYSQMDLNANRWRGSRYYFHPCPFISG